MAQAILNLEKKLWKILLLLVCFSGFSFQGLTQRDCGSIAPSPGELRRNPQLKALFDDINARYQSWSSTHIQRPTVVRVFPVVVHVLYNNNTGDPTNISDAQVFSQINVMNNDFQKLNTDWPNTPATWQGLVANCEIKFCLASKDPNGNYTSGIVRRYTDSTIFKLEQTPKHNTTGGSDAWPTDRYINIWVAPSIKTGTTLGYATFPWDNAGADDGIVIRYTAFGNIGTAAAPYNLGRTGTHEMGHFFGLKHIWGDDEVDANQCAGTDDIGDTPNQAIASGGCPGFPFTDGCSSSSPGIMFMNYMDYTDDVCMYMFTNGQKIWMDFMISTYNNRVAIMNNAANSCGNCDVNLTLVGNSPAGGAFYKAAAINSTQTVSAGGTLIYKAGSVIRLQTGFNCTAGRSFYGSPEPCYPSN